MFTRSKNKEFFQVCEGKTRKTQQNPLTKRGGLEEMFGNWLFLAHLLWVFVNWIRFNFCQWNSCKTSVFWKYRTGWQTEMSVLLH